MFVQQIRKFPFDRIRGDRINVDMVHIDRVKQCLFFRLKRRFDTSAAFRNQSLQLSNPLDNGLYEL